MEQVRIHWRVIIWIGLTWLFIYAGPSWVEQIWHRHCNYLIIATCE